MKEEFDTVRCPTCGGKGYKPISHAYNSRCRECGGSGKVVINIRKSYESQNTQKHINKVQED